MVRSQFLKSVSAEEYSELRAMARIERVGLDRTDQYAIFQVQAAGGELEGNPFAYEEKKERTLDEEFAALAGMVTHGDSTNP